MCPGRGGKGRGEGERGGSRWSKSRSFLSNNELHLPLMYLSAWSFPALSVGPSPVLPLHYLFLLAAKNDSATSNKPWQIWCICPLYGFDHGGSISPQLWKLCCSILTGWCLIFNFSCVIIGWHLVPSAGGPTTYVKHVVVAEMKGAHQCYFCDVIPWGHTWWDGMV